MSDQINRDDEISLLDIAVVIAESWVFSLVVPLIAAILAFAGLNFLDMPQHEARAILRMSEEEAALVTSARVLDPAITQSGWIEQYPGRLSRARQALVSSLAVSPVTDADTYAIALTADTRDRAASTLQAIIDSLIENSMPSEDQRIQLELHLAGLERSLDNFQASLDRLNRIYDSVLAGELQGGTIEIGSLGNSITSLVSQIASTEQDILSPPTALRGSISPADVFQPPTVQSDDNARSHFMRAILVGLAVGFVLLIAVFIRSGLRSAAQDPASIGKVNRIRKAFWLPPKSAEPFSNHLQRVAP